RHLVAVERERDLAAVVRRAVELRLEMLVDGVADVLFQRVGRIAVQRAEPLQSVGDVELDGDALRHGRAAPESNTLDRGLQFLPRSTLQPIARTATPWWPRVVVRGDGAGMILAKNRACLLRRNFWIACVTRSA